MIRVLFVCLGNICRSPMAEAVFQEKVYQAGLEAQIETDSAGTGHWHLGEPPHTGTRRLLNQRGIRYAHRARLFTRADHDAFDYILTMDNANLEDVLALGSGKAQVAPLMQYAPTLGYAEVPDPYYTGGFEEVYQLVEVAATELLATLCRDHDLPERRVR